MGRVEGKVAVVTGGASGIGEATAYALAREGASVVVADINANGAQRVVAQIQSTGGNAVAKEVDVADLAQVREMIETAISQYGAIDILFNNAGAINLLPKDLRIADIDPEIWEQEMRINLTGPMFASKFAIPYMLRRGGGSIIHTSSCAALLGDDSRSGYAASKAGLIALSRSIAVQYGKQGIRSNVVVPGLVLTEGASRRYAGERGQLALDHHMTPRVGRPSDLASAVVFFAGDESEFITGAVLQVDGGLTVALPLVASLRRAQIQSEMQP